MDFQVSLKKSAEEIEKEIQDFLKVWSKDIDQLSPRLLPLTNLLIEYCQGGKRLRGALVKLGYEMYSPSQVTSHKSQEITKVAAAYEIFQTAILAHDDIIDLSETRRGKPTLYRQLGGDHYGISQTIGLGDIGFFLTIKMIAETNFDPILKNQALSFFSQAIINTGLGEVLDVELPHLNQERNEADVIAIHTLKTAYYTISAPLILGAILAGADTNMQKKIEAFGESLGIAFQIQDDILGIFGDEKELGKSVTSDIEEGKNTLLITEALKNATAEQKEVLVKYYGKGKVNEEEVEQIKKVFIDTRSLEYSQKRAEEYVAVAKKLIPEITDNNEYQSLLEQMSDFLVNRTK